MEKENRYLELSRLDCSPGVEVKHGGLSYLSWSVRVALTRVEVPRQHLLLR